METTTQKPTTWNVDNAHSSIHFAVKHMVISQSKGHFSNYKLSVNSSAADFSDAQIELDIDVNSISTGMNDRDNHLRSADFFDVAKYPSIVFKSTSFTKINEEDYVLKGNITIKDVTKEIEFKVSYGGQLVDPWGNQRAGFTLSGSIDRFDFGLVWNTLMETGGALVGKQVKLEAEIEIVRPN